MKPYFAGSFYENNPEKLEKQIENCYKSGLGPGDLPIKRTKKEIKGIIVPHAGYQYSGPCAAWAYKEIAESKIPRTFIILFPDHTGTIYDFATTTDLIETPFGLIKSDKELASKLINTGLIKKISFFKEHSFEVQLPFLFHALKDNIEQLQILPIICPTDSNYKKLAEEIAKNKDISIIISSDFIHHGARFGYTPFKFNIPDSIKEADKKAIELILKYDSEGFLKYIHKTKATICGYYAIALGIEILKNLNSKKAELLCYYDSTKIIQDESQVSYASILFK